jgi:hypothetical protein
MARRILTSMDETELIERLRKRAADPERRTEARPSSFVAGTQAMSIGDLMAGLASARADLDRALQASRRGVVDPQSHARAEAIGAAMNTPASLQLLAPATEQALREAEGALGVELPAFVRGLYTEIADGGFGPGEGLLPLARAVKRYRELVGGEELPRGRKWPAGLVPLVDRDPELECVDAATGKVIAWDPEGLSQRSNEDRFQRSFHDVAGSAAEWLAAWLDSPTVAERMAATLRRGQVEQARAARASIAAKTPEERRAMGLPDVGWEKIVWGGIGLDEDEV